MTKIFYTVILALTLAAGSARAQDTWIQIEALPTLTQAEERARAWSSAFPDVNGFRLASGWYAVAVGPYSEEGAANRLFALRSERLIPSDSFIADGGSFRARFWPVGGGAIAPVAPEAPEAEQPAEPAGQVIVIQPPQPEVIPDETRAEARRSEAQLNADQRKELQVALQWFGFYNAAIDGAFGRGTRASMAAWQAANGYEETGVLTTRQRGALNAAYRADLDALGLGRVVENRAGIEIEMPIRLVEFDDYAPPFVRYGEKDGSGIQVLLISQEGTQATLDGLYDVMQTLEIVPLEGPRQREGRSFTLTGQNAQIHSTSYARLDDGMIKGFTLIYPPDQAERMMRAAQIMRDTLQSIGPALDPTLGAREAVQSRDLLSGLEIRQPDRTRSGVYIDPQGAVLTMAEAVRGCARVTLDDLYEATVVAEDAASGLALLRPEEDLAPLGVAKLALDAPRIGGAAAVAGFPFGSALPSATLTNGTIEDVAGLSGEQNLLRLQAETEAGDAGGPVLDPAGNVAGVLMPAPEDTTRQLPPGVRFAVKAGAAQAFLSEQGIDAVAEPGAPALAPPDLTQAAMAMTVLVSCWN